MSTPAITTSTDATTAAATTSTATTTTAAKAKDAFDVDSNVFMKLLVANLQHQDPMTPQDPTAYMQQMSSMAMVEKLTSVATNSSSSLAEQQATQAIGLLGKKVTYADANGDPATGVVEKVTTAGGTPSLTISGVPNISMSAVAEVATQ